MGKIDMMICNVPSQSQRRLQAALGGMRANVFIPDLCLARGKKKVLEIDRAFPERAVFPFFE